MKYYIDFSTWVIESDSKEEAYKRALSILADGKFPPICEVQDAQDEDEEQIEEYTIKDAVIALLRNEKK